MTDIITGYKQNSDDYESLTTACLLIGTCQVICWQW